MINYEKTFWFVKIITVGTLPEHFNVRNLVKKYTEAYYHFKSLFEYIFQSSSLPTEWSWKNDKKQTKKNINNKKQWNVVKGYSHIINLVDCLWLIALKYFYFCNFGNKRLRVYMVYMTHQSITMISVLRVFLCNSFDK